MPDLTTRRLGVLYLVGFVSTVFLANAMIERFGIIPVGLGLSAPAGVLCAGVAFSLRDLTHDALGRWAVVAAIVAGAALSWLVSPQFAAASGVAFLASETADLLVYSPLRRRSWLGAVALSNSVGLVVDSALFLWLAFSSLEFLPGQILAKTYTTIAAVIVLGLWRWRRAGEAVTASAT